MKVLLFGEGETPPQVRYVSLAELSPIHRGEDIRSNRGYEREKSRAAIIEWGIHNVQAMPWAEVVNVPMDRRQAVQVMRVARRYIWAGQRSQPHPRKIHLRANCRIAFFCDASAWLERLQQLASNGTVSNQLNGCVGVFH